MFFLVEVSSTVSKMDICCTTSSGVRSIPTIQICNSTNCPIFYLTSSIHKCFIVSMCLAAIMFGLWLIRMHVLITTLHILFYRIRMRNIEQNVKANTKHCSVYIFYFLIIRQCLHYIALLFVLQQMQLKRSYAVCNRKVSR